VLWLSIRVRFDPANWTTLDDIANLRVAGNLVDNLASSLDIAFASENGVIVNAMDLDWNAFGPWTEGPIAADRETGVEEQGSASPGACLCEFLRGHHAA
jgi:hypothetical protein